MLRSREHHLVCPGRRVWSLIKINAALWVDALSAAAGCKILGRKGRSLQPQGNHVMKILLAAATASLAMLASPAAAQDNDRTGDVQVKLLGTAVLPDGKITELRVDPGLPAGTQTKANDNYVPTIAIEYFFTNNVSVETICCVTQHDVDAVSGLPGAELVSNARVIPATFTAKYHFDAGGAKPYIGAGATYFLWINDKPGAATTPAPLSITDTDFSDEFGFVLQAGIDIPLSDKGFGLSLDAKRYFVDTTARWFAGDVVVIETEHKLDPWVLSAGVTYTF